MKDKPKMGMSRKKKHMRHEDLREDKKLIEKMAKKKDLKY